MTSSAIVPLKQKQKRRLYEPIVIFKSLTEITHEEGSLRGPDPPDNPSPKTEEQKFYCFLHGLANVCDNMKGGKTVTSIALLEDEDKSVYVFGCNQVFGSGLAAAERFLYELLTTLCGFYKLKGDERISARHDVLKMILVFNLPRLDFYLRDFKKQLNVCLECSEPDNEGLSPDLESYNRVLQALTTFLTPETKTFVDERAEMGRRQGGRSFECWSELRHNLTRLRNYEAVVDGLIEAEESWSGLFQEVEVIPVPSSKAENNPLGKNSETASAIIGRMDSDNTKIDRYRGMAQELQTMHLDDRIKTQCDKISFKPYVHAEILVLEWVLANSSRLGLSFFRDSKYIGSSKGACTLCSYYFDAPGQHKGIRTRSSHGNLYVNWRFPDLFEADGKKGRARRQAIYNSMMERIRDDAFKTMESRAYTGRKHDSSTHPLMSVHHTDVQTDLGARELSDVDELGEQFERELSFSDSLTTNSLGDSESDNEEGGTSLL
ncbi:hypothetical protein FALBO_5320 [Fusarium albosuccineum]|uniref:Uncharacterized protein n=1 Tax=Fusarium albosuccineum TaxID=1237068 RepID=A0A8H4LDR6_9HYPO|nr:hypothetical protein FALBO_5320 [Fusarium albosuccineum]